MVIDHEAFLLTVSEIAAAVVGFSIIAGVIAPDSEGADARRVAMHDVAVIGFTVLAGALLPYLLAAAGVSPPTVWRVASIALLALFGWAALTSLKRFREASGSALAVPLLGPRLVVLNAVIVATTIGLLLWNCVSPSQASSARYLAALGTMLVAVAYLFLKAISSSRE